MLGYVLRRTAIAVPTVLIIVTAVFFLMRLAPGGPFDAERAVSPEIEANLRAAYDLDQPLIVQYRRYLGRLAQGDLGPSFTNKDLSVSELIAKGLPLTAGIGAAAFVLGSSLGILLGVVAALRRNSAIDRLVMVLGAIGIIIPKIVMAPLLALVVGIHLGLLPVGGWEPDCLECMILPVVTLALPMTGYVARLTRGSMIGILRTDYIRTAVSKGLSMRTVVLSHALKPALTPVISYLGPATASLMTGSVVVEQVFGLPGIGRYFVYGAINRDYSLVLGIVLLFSTLITLLNLLVDILYAVLDPRARPS
jgi:oligopeptide transport system permease protein